MEEVASWLDRVIDEPRATVPPPRSPVPGLIVIEEFASPELPIVPVTVGVKFSAPAEAVTVCPRVNPFQERVDVDRVAYVFVVEA